jgi:hypothetical protein
MQIMRWVTRIDHPLDKLTWTSFSIVEFEPLDFELATIFVRAPLFDQFPYSALFAHN